MRRKALPPLSHPLISNGATFARRTFSSTSCTAAFAILICISCATNGADQFTQWCPATRSSAELLERVRGLEDLRKATSQLLVVSWIHAANVPIAKTGCSNIAPADSY